MPNKKYRLKVRMEFTGTIDVVAVNKNRAIFLATVGLNQPTLNVNNKHTWEEGETQKDEGVKDYEFHTHAHNLKIY